MEVVLGHISVEEVVEVSHGHHRQMGGLRMGKSGESGWVSGLRVGPDCEEVIDEYLG